MNGLGWEEYPRMPSVQRFQIDHVFFIACTVGILLISDSGFICC